MANFNMTFGLSKNSNQASKKFTSKYGGKYSTNLRVNFEELPDLNKADSVKDNIAGLDMSTKANSYIVTAIYDLTNKSALFKKDTIFKAKSQETEKEDEGLLFFSTVDYGGYLTILAQLVVANYVSVIKHSHVNSLLKSFRANTSASSSFMIATKVVTQIGFDLVSLKYFLDFDHNNLMKDPKHRDWMKYRTTGSGSASIIIRIYESLGSGFDFLFNNDLQKAIMYNPFDANPSFSTDTLAFCYANLMHTTGELTLWYQGKKAYSEVSSTRIQLWKTFHKKYDQIINKSTDISSASNLEQLITAMKKVYSGKVVIPRAVSMTPVPTYAKIPQQTKTKEDEKDKVKEVTPSSSPRLATGLFDRKDFSEESDKYKYRQKAMNDFSNDLELMRFMEIYSNLMNDKDDHERYSKSRNDFIASVERVYNDELKKEKLEEFEEQGALSPTLKDSSSSQGNDSEGERGEFKE
jgi:hypothetical protein